MSNERTDSPKGLGVQPDIEKIRRQIGTYVGEALHGVTHGKYANAKCDLIKAQSWLRDLKALLDSTKADNLTDESVRPKFNGELAVFPFDERPKFSHFIDDTQGLMKRIDTLEIQLSNEQKRLHEQDTHCAVLIEEKEELQERIEALEKKNSILEEALDKATIDLVKERDELKAEIEMLKDPAHCPVCQSCGEEGCCSPLRCKFPTGVEDAYRENRELLESVCKENESLKAEVNRLREGVE